MAVTDWTPIPSDAVALDERGLPKRYKDWNPGDDDEVVIDLGPKLATGETLLIGEVAIELWQLPVYGESASVDKTAEMVSGAPSIVGTEIRQRLSGLARGRVYRLYVYFGPAGNHRSVTLPIVVSGA